VEFLIRLIKLIIPHVTPEIRDYIRGLLDSLRERAKKTDNPWDDLFVMVIRTILFPE